MNRARDMHPGMALGGVFLTLFGAVWLASASRMVLAGWPAFVAIAGIALAIVVWAMATFFARRCVVAGTVDQAARRRLRRGFMLVNAVQWSLIGLAIGVLNAVGHGNWIAPAVIFVVGVHFVPLGRMLGYRGYYLTATGLVLTAAAECLVKGDHTALSLGATGAILWASAVGLLWALRGRASALRRR